MWDTGAGQLGLFTVLWRSGKSVVSGGISLFPDPGCGPFKLSKLEKVMFPNRLSPHQSSVSKLFLLALFYRWELTLK